MPESAGEGGLEHGMAYVANLYVHKEVIIAVNLSFSYTVISDKVEKQAKAAS